MFALDRTKNLVVFFYDFDSLLKSVWQRTSYMARATKSQDLQNDLREKAMSPDDEQLFVELAKDAATDMHTPLIKFGRHTTHSLNIDRSDLKTRYYNFGQFYDVAAAYSGNKISVTLTKLSTLTDFVEVYIDITLQYAYTVKDIFGDNVTRSNRVTVRIDKSTEGNLTKTFDVEYNCDTTDNGLGAESIVSRDSVVIVSVDYYKKSPEMYNHNDWIEYIDKDGNKSYYTALGTISENENINSRFFDRKMGDYHNSIAYEAIIPMYDANMSPTIDQALNEALVCRIVRKWSEIANPAVIQTATLADERAYEKYDMSVWNSYPHTHRNHLHYY